MSTTEASAKGGTRADSGETEAGPAIPCKPRPSGKLAIQANHRQFRAAAKRAGADSITGIISHQMDEVRARREAEDMLKPPETLVKAHGEVVDREDLGDITSYLVETLESPNMIGVDASEQRMHLAEGAGVLQAAVDTAQSARAGNSLEKMLCHQMAAAHRTAMRLIAYGLNTELPLVEVARLSNAAARMMQIYQEGLLVLQKLRTGGKQTVVVQHVQVSDGGAGGNCGKREIEPEGGGS
jgi:hypothetical protein